MLKSIANVASVPFANSTRVNAPVYRPSSRFRCQCVVLTVACKPLAGCVYVNSSKLWICVWHAASRHKREISMFSIYNTCGSYCLTEIGPLFVLHFIFLSEVSMVK